MPATPRSETATAVEPTLILTGTDVQAVLTMDDCIAAVERVFASFARGETHAPGALGFHVEGGGFHVKVAAADLGRHYFAAKTNGNFPDNPKRRGLPTIQGAIVLSDASDGRVLALMDSSEITTLRTGAATAVAAKHLARADSRVAAIIGCGIQGRVQLVALSRVRRLERVIAVDADTALASSFADEMSAALGIEVVAAKDARDAARAADVIVTCTPSRQPLLGTDDVRPGAFVAAVGADHPEKQELEPGVFRIARVVVDVLEQCLAFGDLRHAVAAGAITPDAVHATLPEIVAGVKPGRTSADERFVFDSTGTALQDVAAAAMAYERSLASGRGQRVTLAITR
jgi:alanine dehydrogenase